MRDTGAAAEINANCVNAVECHTISLHAYLLCLHVSQQNSMTIHQNLAAGLPLHMQQRLTSLVVNKDEFVKQLLCKFYTKCHHAHPILQGYGKTYLLPSLKTLCIHGVYRQRILKLKGALPELAWLLHQMRSLMHVLGTICSVSLSDLIFWLRF